MPMDAGPDTTTPPVDVPGQDAQDTGVDTGVDSGTDTRVDSASEGGAHSDRYAIRFEAMVGNQPFSCSRTYPMMGMGAMSTWTPKDFRFYVHDVRLVTEDGEVPIEIETAGAFQGQGVALLDFEDRSGSCSEGTTETNNEVRGRAMQHIHSGIRGIKFKVGVPFMLNHRDPSSSPAPLNLSAMWWTWNAGYKFLKIDGSTAGLPMGFNIHLGSTGCMGNNAGPVNPCTAPNVVDVTLMNFDPATHRIVADLAALVSMSNLEQNTPMTSAGCMSSPSDPDCAPIFSAIGLPFGGMPASTQRFFRVEMR
jgi:uncharacterized repeat protein (TIGR04052 family)